MLRDAGFSALLHCGGGSFKSQMKKADGSGTAVAAIIGDDEAAANTVNIEPLRVEGAQRTVAFEHVADAVAEAIYGTEE